MIQGLVSHNIPVSHIQPRLEPGGEKEAAQQVGCALARQVYVNTVTQLKRANRAADLEYLDSQEPPCLRSMFYESSEEGRLLYANFLPALPRLK